MKVILSIAFITLLVSFFFTKRKLSRLEEEQKLSVDELWDKKRTSYLTEISKFEKLQEEAARKYNEEKSRIDQEITEKQNFNNSLFKIREQELDRLIEEKRKEKETLLNEQLKTYEQQNRAVINAEFFEFMAQQEKTKEEVQKEVQEMKLELEDFRLQREAVNQAIMREKEKQEQESFYKIDISEHDREDMSTLLQIAPQLRNKEALNKLVYEVFVKRPLTELIKRITSGRSISGIYKITYVKTGEAYIGRTTDIQTRWQNHIKTACGLDGAARTTFHSRLEKDGIWNYTFEILEEAPKEKLSEREKFYIDLYGTHNQLNSKRGG